jgi:hypothetical protein
MRTIGRFAASLAAVLALGSGAVRAGDDLIIALKFIPTSKPGQVRAELKDGLSGKAIALLIDDARAVKTKDIVGEGTGRGDDTFRIRSAGYMPSYLKSVLTDRFSAWGVLFDDSSDLVLRVRATRYYVRETHQAFNSVFQGEVQLPWTLMDRAGHVFAQGTALGTGTTKGMWRNPVNCEEVLGDALERATATILSDATLQDAWLAAKPEHGNAVLVAATPMPKGRVTMLTADGRYVPAPRPPAPPKSPSQLLGEVNKLRRQQLGTDVLVAYVAKQQLSSAFTADDLVAWKKAGVPDPVMKEAVKRAP